MLEFYKDTEFQSYCRGTPKTGDFRKIFSKRHSVAEKFSAEFLVEIICPSNGIFFKNLKR